VDGFRLSEIGLHINAAVAPETDEKSMYIDWKRKSFKGRSTPRRQPLEAGSS